jgi:hypothetical protein
VGQNLVFTDIYIPGGEAKTLPRRDRMPPLSVRLLEVKPAQEGYRYDFEVQGFDPGVYDLASFLVAVDPAQPPRFPKIPLEIRSDLPPGIQLPHELKAAPDSVFGGYRVAMIFLGTFWLMGFVAFVCWFRWKPSRAWLEEERVPTAADRLRPLIHVASLGRMEDDRRALLERLLIGYWRERLPEIGALPPMEALIRLRSHPEAAPLLRAMERWLHARHPKISEKEIEHLLAPYR